jgi:predicted DNA-binding transcriptional regulator AlpA
LLIDPTQTNSPWRSVTRTENGLLAGLAPDDNPKKSRSRPNLLDELARDPDRILNSRQASAFCGLGVHRWRQLCKTGRAPKPFLVGERIYGWRFGEVVAWLNQRACASGGMIFQKQRPG